MGHIFLYTDFLQLQLCSTDVPVVEIWELALAMLLQLRNAKTLINFCFDLKVLKQLAIYLMKPTVLSS